MGIRGYVKDVFGDGWTIINWANPNRHGYIGHIEKDGEHVIFEEGPDGDYPNEYSVDDMVEAEKVFEEWREELLNTPNWELQSEYDELHGTVNGYSPWQFEHEY